MNIDIDDRKRTEAALGESEARFQTVFETIDAGFCIVEIIRGEEGRVEDLKFVATNRALEKQTGLDGLFVRQTSRLRPQPPFWG